MKAPVIHRSAVSATLDSWAKNAMKWRTLACRADVRATAVATPRTVAIVSRDGKAMTALNKRH